MDFPRPIHDFLLVFFRIRSSIRRSGSGITSQPNICGLFLRICSCLYIFIVYSIKIPFCRCCTAPYLHTSWYWAIWTTRLNQILEQDLISNSVQIGIHLSTEFFLPFELISIILLAALIGAIAVARQ